jgi:hypothetical protein
MEKNIISLHTSTLENDLCYTILIHNAEYLNIKNIKKIKRHHHPNKDSIIKSNITTIIDENNNKFTIGHHIGTIVFNNQNNDNIKAQIYNYPEFSNDNEPKQLIFIPKNKTTFSIPIFIKGIGNLYISTKFLYKQFKKK